MPRHSGAPSGEPSGTLPATPGPFPPAGELRTGRLLLRPFRPGEAAAVHAYASRPGFFRFLDQVPEPVRTAYTRSDADGHLRDLIRLAGSGWPHWAITLGGSVVGAVRLQPGPDGPELGYGIAPERWGQGIASEAVGAAVAWAGARVPELWARTHPGNLASQRVLLRLGFAPDGSDPRGRSRYLRRAPTERAMGQAWREPLAIRAPGAKS